MPPAIGAAVHRLNGYNAAFSFIQLGVFMAAEGAGDLVRVVSLLGAAVVAVPLFKRLGLGSV
ncbi:MAG: hypothetical protein ACFNUL_01935, partial [Cardiobacterium hominis]